MKVVSSYTLVRLIFYIENEELRKIDRENMLLVASCVCHLDVGQVTFTRQRFHNLQLCHIIAVSLAQFKLLRFIMRYLAQTHQPLIREQLKNYFFQRTVTPPASLFSPIVVVLLAEICKLSTMCTNKIRKFSQRNVSMQMSKNIKLKANKIKHYFLALKMLYNLTVIRMQGRLRCSVSMYS